MRYKPLAKFIFIVSFLFININKNFSQSIFHKYGFIAETRGVHNFFIKPNGELYGWGGNNYGTVGDGSTNDVLSPIQIMPEKKWKYVTGGYSCSFAIDSLGFLYAWGDNTNELLGTGNNLSSTIPVKLNLNVKFKKVFSGWYHTFAIDESGFLWGWGSNSNGQLGDGTLIDRNTPKLIDNNRKWMTISASINHSLGIDSSGVLFGWGGNGKYQLTDQVARTGTSTITKLSDDIWNDVGSGSAFSIALNSQGKAYSWGSNFPFDRWGSNLGYNTTDSNSKVITLINNDTDWVDVSAGYGFSELLKSDGTIWVTHGPGNGLKYPGYIIPTKIDNIAEKLVSVSGANTQIFTLSENGKVYGWGDNSVGILGIGNRSSIEFPTKFSSQETNWAVVSMGKDVAAGIKNDGTLWIWGNNASGEIPLIKTASNVPVLLSSETDWVNVSAMDKRIMAVKSDGTLWGIGDNSGGSLGLGPVLTISNTLVKIGNDNDWAKVMLGWFNTIALKKDGTLWSCGWNGDGRNGQPIAVGNHYYFTQIGVDNDWKNFSTKANHTIALKNDGSIYSFGLNEKGQLGLGNLISKDVPTRIGLDNDWIIVDASYQYSMALKTNGRAYSWGDNLFGQLSRSYLVSGNLSPGLVTGVPLLKNLELGYRSATFVTTSNFLYVVGSNQAYELGIGQSVSSIYTPQLQSNDGNWASLSSGVQSTIGIKNDGTLCGWGENVSGQVGGKVGFVSPFMPNVALVNADCPPFGIADSVYEIKEKTRIGDSVFTISINDYNFNNTHSIIIPNDSVGNSIFSITGTTFFMNGIVDFKLKKNYKFDIKIIDNTGLSTTKTIYVNVVQQNGMWNVDSSIGNNDTGNGTSLNPFKTIQKAIDVSISGDTIVIGRGIYKENLISTKSLVIGSKYLLNNDTSFRRSTILDATKTGIGINLNADSTRLVGFTIQNGYSSMGAGVYSAKGKIELRNMIIQNCSAAGDINGAGANLAGKVTISNSEFYFNTARKGGALVLGGVSSDTTKIENCIFKANYASENGSAIALFGSINNVIQVSNSIFLKNYGGEVIHNQGNNLVVYHSNFINNVGAFNTSSGSIIVKNSIIRDSTTSEVNSPIGPGAGNIRITYSNIKGGFTGEGNIDYNEKFLDTFYTKIYNYSASIGAGSMIPSIKTDYFGNPRPTPSGTNPDIGAFETESNFQSPYISKVEPGNKKVALFWSQTPNTNIIAYKVYRSTSSIPDNSTSTFIADVTGVGTLYYNDESADLVNGTTYYYRLKAVHNDNSVSGLSNELTAIPDDVALPTNFKLDNGPSTARINWTSVDLTGAKYQLFRGTNVNTKTLLADSVSASTYDDATLARNTNYFYWIKAMNANGALSEFSVPLTLTPTNIWYVDSAIGNNTAGLGSLAAPYLKIQKGIDKSINGDTVYIKPGTYNESLLINKAILLKSTDGVIKTKLIQESGIGYSMKVYNPAFSAPFPTTKISGFYMKGNGNMNNSIGLRVEQNAYATLDNIFMDGYDLNLSTYYGYYSVNNSIFYGSRIFAYGDAGDPDISNIVQNSSILNTSWSVYEAGTNSTNKYYNLIIVNEKSKPFQSPNPFNGPRPYLYNVILDKTFASYNPQDGSVTYIVDDAESMRFKNFALKDFRLENSSPAIGFGNITLPSVYDYDGLPRPNPIGSNPDAGAFESIYDHPAPYIDTDSSRNGYILLKMTQTPVGSVNQFFVYKGLEASPTTKYTETALVNNFRDSANDVFNKVLFYRLTSKGASGLESGYSNEVRTIAFTPPSLNFPIDFAVKADTNINYQWEKIDNATKYKIQYSTDSNFVNNVVEFSKTDTSFSKIGLVDNTSYFWRLQTSDSVHFSKWSNWKRFQTFVRKPMLNTIASTNNNIALAWSVNNTRNLKAFKIYRGTTINPTTKLDSISATNFTYNDSVSNGIKYYYRITAVNTDNIESDFSNELFANSFDITVLDSPSNNKVKEVLTPNFTWQAIQSATKYNIQITADSTLANINVLDTVTALTSLSYTRNLADNTTFYWRVRVGDEKGYSNWTEKNTFQTFVLAPILLNASPSNKRDTLSWSVQSPMNIKYFKIYRDTVQNPLVLIDSIESSFRSYIDTASLKINTKYYYRIIAGNNEDIESVYSNELYATPFNTLPRTVALVNKNFSNVGEFNYVRSNYSALGSIDPDGSIVNYTWSVNDSLVNGADSILIYYFNQGSNKVKLVITDNDGGKDSSSAVVNLSSFTRTFEGGFLGGITALSPNIIYTADTTYNPINGASISKLDRSGNTIYPLVVSSKIFTTPSISSDSSVFITSGSSLNGFNKSGAPLWSTIPLGGLSYVTPTIDSLFSRIYVGVSNKNFFAIDYKTGKVVWNLIGDAPVNASAVITGDRKLVFTSEAGTLYGFDIRTDIAQTAAKWTSNFGEIITKSPAVDKNNNLIIGTATGKVLKVQLNEDGTVATTWSVNINAPIKSSPVIDADGFIYIGNQLGDFYKLNPDNGATIWKHETGAAIKSTPTISEFGNVYIANTNGLVTALTTDNLLKWTYQADGAISANMLYINNMLYIGTETGKFFALYDNPSTNTVNTGLSLNMDKNRLKTYSYSSMASASPLNMDEQYGYYYDAFKQGKFNFAIAENVLVPKEPVWGTFQGNYRRTGSKTFECPEVPVVKIPNCIESADTIKITTSSLTNKYWVVNDVVLNNVTDTAIYIKPTDRYKLMAFNTNGCNVYSSNPILISNSAIAKPKITTNSGATKFCEGDSIVLSSNISANKYQWNYLSSPVAEATARNLSTSLQGAYSVTAINEFGCKSTSDISLILATPKPAVAAIDGVNALCIGSTTKLTNTTIGGIWSSGSEAIARVDASGNISTLAAGSVAISYTISSNGCSNASKINIKVNETPALPKVIATNFCVGGTASALQANALGGHSLYWYGTNATGGIASGTAPIPSTSTQGITDYYVSQSNNSTSCESPRTKLTVSVGEAPPTPTITRDVNGNLISSASIGNQWYKNGTEIIGANSNIFKPTEVTNANYAVKIQGVCVSAMSTIYYFIVTDVINLSATEFIKLAPNPFVNKMNFDFFLKGYNKLNLEVFELSTGALVASKPGIYSGTPILLGQLSSGMYIVKISSADGKLSYQFKMVKI